MPLQRACGAESQVRNKLSNGPLRAQSNVSIHRVFCDVAGRRHLPGICWYPAKRTGHTVNQGGTADSIFALFVLDRTYISVKDVFVLLLWQRAPKEYFYLEVLIMKIFPDLSDVKKIAATGNYNVLPVSL